MMVVEARTPTHESYVRAGAVAVALGLVLLLARPLVARTFGWTTLTVAAVFTSVLVLGLATPAARSRVERGQARLMVAATAGGVAVFLLGWVAASGRAPYPATVTVVTLNTLAAVAEEALFRRLAFSLLLPAGPGVAIVGSAVLFGLAHATVYGWWAVPLDTAAGLVLGWQRWVSGSWALPALTHAFADLLVVI
jgi:membrane protease YdiL (CAAX protease family)